MSNFVKLLIAIVNLVSVLYLYTIAEIKVYLISNKFSLSHVVKNRSLNTQDNE